MRDIFKLTLCNSLLTHWEEAFYILKNEGVQDIHAKMVSTYSNVKNSKGLYIQTTKKYNDNMCSYKLKTPPKNNIKKWERILKERSNMLYGKGGGAAGLYLKKTGTILSIKESGDTQYKLAELTNSVQNLNIKTKIRVKFLDTQQSKQIPIIDSAQSYMIDHINPLHNFVTEGFYFGKNNLPNIYDIVYHIFLTEIEILPEEDLNNILTHIFVKIYNKDITDLVSLDKKIDFFDLNTTKLDLAIIRIIFQSYFSNLSTHPFIKFSFFLTEKMYNLANSESGGEDKIKYLIIPKSSKKSKKKTTRTGHDGYILYTIEDGDLVKTKVKPTTSFAQYYNKTFFPSPQTKEKLSSDLYGFMYTKEDSSEFYVVLKQKTDPKNETKTGRVSRKSNRTGAPCGRALGIKSIKEISKVCNILLNRITGNANIRRYNSNSTKKTYLPSMINLCSELKLLLRYADNKGLIKVSSGDFLDLNTRYFYHSAIKNKIDRLIEDQEE